MPTLAERYIQLAFGIQEYFPGYIDAYFGPAELKNTEKKSLEDLSRAAKVLAEDSKDASRWLQTQIASMQTVLAKLSEETISYLEEVRNVYDIEPERVDESHFEKAHTRLDELLEGSGSLFERLEAFRKCFVVPAETLPKVIDAISSELRVRTKKRFNLPSEETFSLEFVSQKPWGGYNWYEGNYRSRIDINMDLPKYLHGLPHLLAHEGYPGHHTEHVLKEKGLCREQGRLEHTLYLLNSPESVQAEGIAESALDEIMTKEDIKELLIELLPVANVQASKEDIEKLQGFLEAYHLQEYVSSNAALLLHEQGISEKEVLEYLHRYSLNSPASNQKTLEFLKAPSSAAYVFTYTVGKDLVQHCLQKGVLFEQLLREAYTPSMMRELAARA
jgi:hypothetical protein